MITSKHSPFLVLFSLITCGGCLTVVIRHEWGARKPESVEKIHRPVPYIIIHHTATRSCRGDACKAVVRSIQNYHMDEKRWGDIAYSFLIGADGRVYKGRGWGVVGTHTYHYNKNGYGIALIGNFMGDQPTNASLKSVKSLISDGVRKGYIERNYTLIAHRNVGTTLCPGDKLYRIIKDWPHFKKHPV